MRRERGRRPSVERSWPPIIHHRRFEIPDLSARTTATSRPTAEALRSSGLWAGLPYPLDVKRVVILYGLSGGLLIAALKAAEYRFVVVEHSIEIYGGLIALVFAAVGVRLGLMLTGTKQTPVNQGVTLPATLPFAPDEARVSELGLTRRELEILQQIA